MLVQGVLLFVIVSKKLLLGGRAYVASSIRVQIIMVGGKAWQQDCVAACSILSRLRDREKGISVLICPPPLSHFIQPWV